MALSLPSKAMKGLLRDGVVVLAVYAAAGAQAQESNSRFGHRSSLPFLGNDEPLMQLYFALTTYAIPSVLTIATVLLGYQLAFGGNFSEFFQKIIPYAVLGGMAIGLIELVGVLVGFQGSKNPGG